MPSIPRFFAPAATAPGTTIALPEDEATHLSRVLRLKPGDAVAVFNGRGSEWRGRVEQSAKKAASVRLLESATPAREPGIAITLAVAVLKGDKMDAVVRDAVMLGATVIQPLVATRSEVALASLVRSARLERWQRIAIASVKQSGRAVLPEIRPAVSLETLLEQAGPTIMFAEPGVAASSRAVTEVPRSDHATVLIGPEGGWTPDEVEQAAQRSAMFVTLGAQTIRADAMPIVALTALRALWGDL